MLAQRLAELASANAEGLLEYVALMNWISDLALNRKLATTNIGYFARICLSDSATQQFLGRILPFPLLVQVVLILPKVSAAS